MSAQVVANLDSTEEYRITQDYLPLQFGSKTSVLNAASFSVVMNFSLPIWQFERKADAGEEQEEVSSFERPRLATETMMPFLGQLKVNLASELTALIEVQVCEASPTFPSDNFPK